MNNLNKGLLLTIFFALLSACNPDPTASSTGVNEASSSASPVVIRQSIDELFTRFTDRWMENDPNAAIRTAYFPAEKQDEFETMITPLTREYQLARIALAREGLAELAQIDYSQGSETQRRSAEVMKWQLEMMIANEPYLDYINFPLEQMRGANNGLVRTFTISHPMQNIQDAENYVQRLREVDLRMQEATYDMRQRAEQDIHPPSFILISTIAQMQNFISSAPQDNPFVTTLLQKSEGLEGLGDAQRESLVNQAISIVEDEIYPAWEAAIAQLQNQLPRATEDAGLSRFPGGAEIYAQQLKAYNTTDLTADEIHQIGLQEVARIESEMDSLFEQIGITEGSISDRVAELQTRLIYPNTDAGREELMSDLAVILEDAVVRSRALFDEVPKSEVIVQPYPEFMWENAAASYSSPPLDGSRPGIFQMPLRTNRLTSFSTRSLVYHETVPGHHFQLALVNENEDLHRFARIGAYGGNSAIVEGWALYAERLAVESGWYEGDIEGHLGQLDSALFRARRLVVDTGLHTKGWTRQQAIDYGISPSEVERYVTMAGQATSYMIGQLKIVELRERAREALGDDFSINEFHNTVLNAGIVPLTMLEGIINEYIASAR